MLKLQVHPVVGNRLYNSLIEFSSPSLAQGVFLPKIKTIKSYYTTTNGVQRFECFLRCELQLELRICNNRVAYFKQSC